MPYPWVTGDTITAARLNPALLSLTAYVAANTWGTRTAVPTGKWRASGAIIGTKVSLISGATTTTESTSTTTTHDEYDTSTNAWTSRAAITSGVYSAVGRAAGGKVYVVGGYNSGGTRQTTNYEYTPSPTNTWATKAAMTTGTADMAAAELSGLVYLFGGVTTTTGVTTTQYYDPVANTYTSRASMGTGRYGNAGASDGTYVYAFGGTSANPGTCERYDATANSWSSRANAPARIDICRGDAVGSVIIVCGGSSYATTNATYEYNPSTNAWSTKTSASTGHGYGIGVGDSSFFYYMTGYSTSVHTTNERFAPSVIGNPYTSDGNRAVIAYASGVNLTNQTTSVSGRIVMAKAGDLVTADGTTDVLIL